MGNSVQRIVHWVSHIVSHPFVNVYLDPRYHPKTVPGSDTMPKPPFIMVANHGTFFDPWLIGRYSMAPVHYMCNDDAWRAGPVTCTYLDYIGAFPKKKGGVDYTSIKTTLKLLAAGRPVCIFPEGQTSWDGETQLIYRGMERLIKKARVPVVLFNLCGNFLIKPWWAETRRRGRVLISLRVLDEKRVRDLSDDELFDTIRRGVYHNDIKDERNLEARFSGHDLTAGLERFVWMCMHCGAGDRLVTNGDDITCEACGGSWRMDAHCRFSALSDGFTTLADLMDWSTMHKEKVKARIAECPVGEELTTSDEVMLRTVMDDGYTFVDRARGTLRVNSERLSFEPQSGSDWRLSVPLEEVRDTVVQKRDVFEFRRDQTHYRFEFSGHSPMKWVWYLRYLHGYAELEERGYL